MTKSKVAGVAACVVAIGSCMAVAMAQSAASPASQAASDGTQFLRITNETVTWVDYPGDGAQFGIKEAFIYGDPTKPGLYVIRLKFPPGVMSRPHSHPETRIGTVIKGTWWTGTGDKFDPKSTTAVPTGGMMIHPAGKVHYDGARDEETIVQMMGIGPTGKTTAIPGDPGFSRQ
jgi:quercetin dioxygenase-like cupin family protein